MHLTKLAEFACTLSDPICDAVTNQEPRPFLEELPRDRLADPAPCAGDDPAFSLKTQHRKPPVCLEHIAPRAVHHLVDPAQLEGAPDERQRLDRPQFD